MTNLLWDQQLLVATADFNPFTGEATAPASQQLPSGLWKSTRLRASSKPGATARPVPHNLLEMGLACGDGAKALEERLQQADAAKCLADRATGDRALTDQVGNDPGGRIGAEGDEQADAAPATVDEGPVLEGPSPQAIVALTTEIQTLGRTRARLAAENESLERQESALKARLLRALGHARSAAVSEKARASRAEATA